MPHLLSFENKTQDVEAYIYFFPKELALFGFSNNVISPSKDSFF